MLKIVLFFYFVATNLLLAADITYTGTSQSFYHQIGHAEGTTWIADTTNGEGWMTYGPYTNLIPQGQATIDFLVMIDNNTFDNLHIMTVDVYDTQSKTVLASLAVKRRDFTAAFTSQKFTLAFQLDSPGELEFRIYVKGYAYLKHEKTVIHPNTNGFTSLTAGQSFNIPYKTLSLSQAQTKSIGPYLLAMQADGNLVLYKGITAVWNTGTYGQICSSCTANFHTNGNFVVTNPNAYNENLSIWNSQTFGNQNATLLFSSGPSVIQIKKENGDAIIWDSSYQNYSYLGNSPFLGHVIGYPTGSAWNVLSSMGAGYMTFGPYTQLPPGVSTAVFRLKVDNNNADTLRVAKLEVFDFNSGKILAYRMLHRNHFTQANKPQDFDLVFESKSSSLLEYRVYVYGNSYIQHAQTMIYPERVSLNSLWTNNAHFNPKAKNSLGGVTHSLVTLDGTWFALSRQYFELANFGNCAGNKAMRTVINKSTDHGGTWSSSVIIASPTGGSGPDACAITDGSLFFDPETGIWHLISQCLGKPSSVTGYGNWNLCHYTRNNLSPVGPFNANTKNPVVKGGDLWRQICSGPGKNCPTNMVDEGTPQIIQKVGSYFYVTFHGWSGVEAARGIARTTDFVNYKVAGADLPGDAMLSKRDCGSWNPNCIGFGNSVMIRSCGYHYQLAEATNLSLVCVPGQNWWFGLMRSPALSRSGQWESYFANPYIRDYTSSPYGCEIQYQSILRDRGRMFLHFNYYTASPLPEPAQLHFHVGGTAPNNPTPNQTFELLNEGRASQISVH